MWKWFYAYKLWCESDFSLLEVHSVYFPPHLERAWVPRTAKDGLCAVRSRLLCFPSSQGLQVTPVSQPVYLFLFGCTESALLQLFSSVADCSTLGLPVHHQLPELAQTHVCLVGCGIFLGVGSGSYSSFQSMGSRECGLQQLWCMGLLDLWHVKSSQTRDGTHHPCIGRWILNHWTTREVSNLCLLCLHMRQDVTFLKKWRHLFVNVSPSLCIYLMFTLKQ